MPGFCGPEPDRVHHSFLLADLDLCLHGYRADVHRNDLDNHVSLAGGPVALSGFSRQLSHLHSAASADSADNADSVDSADNAGNAIIGLRKTTQANQTTRHRRQIR